MIDATQLNQLELAILWTLLYGDIFDFPMSAGEIHRYLIDTEAEREAVQAILDDPQSRIASYIVSRAIGERCYYAIRQADSDELFVLRKKREADSAQLWPQARRYGQWIGHLPFVRMVAITGSLAVRNVTSVDDDFDYLIVVQNGRVWLARLMAVVLVRFCKLLGVVLCPNYVLAEDALLQSKQNSFIAHELAQMSPVVGHGLYHQMRIANAWSAKFLPNAQSMPFSEPDGKPRGARHFMQFIAELMLSGWLGNRLERWERERKIRKFSKEITPTSDAKLDEQHVKGHFEDYGLLINARFRERLDRYALPYPHFAIQTGNPTNSAESAAD